MINSPLIADNDLPTFKILVNGSEIRNFYEVFSISVDKEINAINTAKIVLLDGDTATETFPASESADFVPGTSVEIQMGYHATDVPVFKGVIMSQSIKVRSGTHKLVSQLTLKCVDMAAKLTITRKSAYYADQKDSDIISKIISSAGLSLQVDATAYQHPKVVQYDATDWDFLMSRAEVNGYVVICNDGAIQVQAPVFSGDPLLAVTYGLDVIDFQAELDAQTQLSDVICSAWDATAQNVVSGNSIEPNINSQGNISGQTLAGVLGVGTYQMQTTVSEDASVLTTWAKAKLLKSRTSKIKGSVTFPGNSSPQLGKLIKLNGFGTRINGNAYISRIIHTFEAGSWTTTVGFGLSSKWFAEEKQIVSPPAMGLLPGIQGLQIGTVKQIDQDPEGSFRILVNIPMISMAGDGVWSRLLHEYASGDVGTFFIPEVGDEVILGFLNEDPRFPIVLGSVYSKKNKPPYTPDATNKTKAIVTKSKLKLEFDEEKKNITLETPAGNKLIISDDQKSIMLTDQNKNKIAMSADGIIIDSPKDIKITSKGSFSVDAVGVTINSKADVNIEGNNVSAKAKMTLTVQGTAQAALKASGQVEVKGAMVMIN